MTNYEKEVLRNIIYAVETGGQVYGNKDYADFTEEGTNTDNEVAITIGAGQWYGPEAKTLLNLIRQTDSVTFNSLDTAGVAADLDSSDWSTYSISKSSAKARCIVRIIDTEIGHLCQDRLLDQQMEQYVNEAVTLDVTALDAQMMCANLRHLGGLSAVERILGSMAKPYTLDAIYARLQQDTKDGQVGTFRDRNEFVFNTLKQYITNRVVTKEAAIEAMINVARNELGYLEKESNSQLDSKTANAGNNNYTKYWRDLLPSYQGESWCACFVTWVLEQAFGEATARALLGIPSYPYTWVDDMRTYRTLETTPHTGDLVVYWSEDKGRYSHVGLVVDTDGVNFTTIEGNTNAMAGVESNGNGVYEKFYDIYNSKKPRFVHLDYTLVNNIMGGGAASDPYPKEDNFKATGTATCTGNGVRVRKTPNGSILGNLSLGTIVEVDGVIDGDWVHVKAAGIGVGYMHKDYVDYGSSEGPAWTRTGYATCTGNGVYVRKTPNGSIIGQLYVGDQFEVDGTNSGVWVHVKAAGIGVGYMHEDYVSTSSAWTKKGTAYCSGNGVYVRETPGGSSMGQLYKGDSFEVDGKKSGSWVHVKVPNIGIGYMHHDYVSYGSFSSKTDLIKTAQQALNSLFSLGVDTDGSWGSASKKAYIKAIQKALNSVYGESLSVDGSFGSATKAAVKAHVLSRGMKNTYVAVLQIGLLAHGYSLSNGVDSSFGPSTEENVIDFQSDVGILANGKAGIDTFTHLAGQA